MNRTSIRTKALVISATTLILLGTAAGAQDKTASRQIGVGALPPGAQAQISDRLGQDRSSYHAVADQGGFSMSNGTSGLAAGFTPAGADFRSGQLHWGISLTTYGYGEQLTGIALAAPKASANRVEYQRDGLTEWYVNGPLGIEQGFTLAHAPRAPASGKRDPLTLNFRVTGDLTASVDSTGQTLTLKKGHADVLRYTGLVATDAKGREQHAWLELAGSELRLHVEDANAEYPLNIDPMVQVVELTSNRYPCFVGSCITGQTNDLFGYSVSMSSDGKTIVVGATGSCCFTPTPTPGAAYVFVMNRFGWGCPSTGCENYAAKLTPSDGTAGDLFGTRVAISGDGNTVAVISEGTADNNFSAPGVAYVYVKGSTGWASGNEIAKLTINSGYSGGCCYGSSISVSGDGSVIVLGYAGARYFKSGVLGNYGAAFTFGRPGNGWATTSAPTGNVLTSSDGVAEDQFGNSVSISSDGSTIAVGAFLNPHNTSYSGAVYVFTRYATYYYGRTDASGYENAKLTSSSGQTGLRLGFGVSVNASGNTIAAYADSPFAGEGQAYVFLEPPQVICRVGGGCIILGFAWQNTTETAVLTTSDHGATGGQASISGDGSTIVMGPYLYARPAAGWASSTQSQKVSLANGASWAANNSDGTVAVIGTPTATVGSNTDQGAAFVFSGYAGTPIASISPLSLSFGNQAVGTTSNSQQVTLTNTGNAPLHITGVSANAPFTTTTNCLTAGTIAVGGSCSEQLTFAPSSVGSFNSALTFTDDSGGTAGTTQQVPLSGTGIKAGTTVALMVSPSAVLTGNPATVSFTVIPQAGDTLTPSGTVTITASTGEQCSATAPSGSCSLSFATAGNRTVTAVYSGDSNFNGSSSAATPVQVVDFSVSATPSSQSIVTGKGGTYTITVTAINGFTGTVTLACGAPSGVTCGMSPTQVSLAGNAVTSSAVLSVAKTATKGTYTLTFTGSYAGNYGTGSRTTTAALTIK